MKSYHKFDEIMKYIVGTTGFAANAANFTSTAGDSHSPDDKTTDPQALFTLIKDCIIIEEQQFEIVEFKEDNSTVTN